MKILTISIIIILLLGVSYFIYGVCWTYKLKNRQNAVGMNLLHKFRNEQPLLRDKNGSFYISVGINHGKNKDFILDTKATSMVRAEIIPELGASYWSRYPIPVKNLYGQLIMLPVYESQNIIVGGQILEKPLFKYISKTNALHNLIYRDILGVDILKHFVWKFSLDEEKLILFSNRDSAMLKTEVEGFYEIKDGLKNDNLPLSIPSIEYCGNFNFDLGYQGEISINKELFESLIKIYPCDKYLNERTMGRIDTTYLFNKVDIKLGDIAIPNCTLCYYPLVNKNLVGVKLMDRFNFVLGYQKMDDSKYSMERSDFYIQPRKNFDTLITQPIYPSLGFDVNVLGEELLVTLIKIGGKADKSGLKVHDKVLEIDEGSAELNPETVLSGEVSSYLSKKQKVRIKVERDKKVIECIIE